MEFLGIGYQELLLILVLMLVVVGPERLPGMAYQIGRAVRQLQLYARQVRDEFSDEIGYLEEQYRTVKGEVDSTRESIRQEQLKLNSELREATEPFRSDPALTNTNTSSPNSDGKVVSIGDGQPHTASSDSANPATAAGDVDTPKSSNPPLVF